MSQAFIGGSIGGGTFSFKLFIGQKSVQCWMSHQSFGSVFSEEKYYFKRAYLVSKYTSKGIPIFFCQLNLFS